MLNSPLSIKVVTDLPIRSSFNTCVLIHSSATYERFELYLFHCHDIMYILNYLYYLHYYKHKQGELILVLQLSFIIPQLYTSDCQ